MCVSASDDLRNSTQRSDFEKKLTVTSFEEGSLLFDFELLLLGLLLPCPVEDFDGELILL